MSDSQTLVKFTRALERRLQGSGRHSILLAGAEGETIRHREQAEDDGQARVPTPRIDYPSCMHLRYHAPTVITAERMCEDGAWGRLPWIHYSLPLRVPTTTRSAA